VNEATPQARGEPAADAYLAERPNRGEGAWREITIPGLVRTLWRGLWLVAAVILLAVLATGFVLKLEAPVYTATMIVAPAQADLSAASQLASQLEQFASLATLAQTPAKIEQVSELERYVQLFRSTTLASRLQAEHQLLQTIFVDQWDPQRQSWRTPSGVVAAVKEAVLGFFGYPAWTPPNETHLAEWLAHEVNVSRLGGSSLLRIQLRHWRPHFASSVIEWMHQTADQMLREEALTRIDAQSAQAESELASATTPTRRTALEEVLVGQYQAQALLRAEQPYAAQIVVPAVASAGPTSANPLLILALAAVTGAIIGVFLVFLRDALRSVIS
jgi:capsular polysaccharide biosynthesis protein